MLFSFLGYINTNQRIINFHLICMQKNEIRTLRLSVIEKTLRRCCQENCYLSKIWKTINFKTCHARWRWSRDHQRQDKGTWFIFKHRGRDSLFQYEEDMMMEERYNAGYQVLSKQKKVCPKKECHSTHSMRAQF